MVVCQLPKNTATTLLNSAFEERLWGVKIKV